MKIRKIQVSNYRLLKKFSLDLEDDLSLVIGKNNCGKTSLLQVLNKFLNNGKLTSNDFNLDYKKEVAQYLINSFPNEDEYAEDGIFLKLFIEYGENDELSNISNLMMDLEEENNQIILHFEYSLTYEKLQKMKADFDNFSEFKGNDEEKFTYFFANEYDEYFAHYKKSILQDEEGKIVEFIDLIKENINLKNIINYKFISAKREVSNKDNKTLSSQTSQIYEKSESTPEQKEAIKQFKLALLNTDKVLDGNYGTIFEKVIEKVKRFGGIRNGESNISIHSTLQHKELLKGNTTVMYSHEEELLPEHYNGLGYMNLISMIFEIETLLIDFKKTLEEKPADINLLFIEEPEAHTHPQMQYIFIRNIKSLLKDGIKREDGNSRELQYIISTHSSHIVSESDFHDIKYLKKISSENSVISKNLKDLEREYEANGEEDNYRFLKQYLTLNRAELFFADKAILIEGDTERILVPAMMKKIDDETLGEDQKLLSQNISIVEVGAYSQIFEKFIDFIGIKTLILTDIDSVDNAGSACEVSREDASKTSNSSLNYFFATADITDYINRSNANKLLSKNATTNKWEIDANGFLFIVYQINETNSDNVEYHSRSFEDNFFHINKKFMQDNIDSFPVGIKNPRYMNNTHDDYVNNPYYWAENCVDKKPSLAIEILMNSLTDSDGKQFTNWNIPSYIKEGLIWLKDN